MVTRIRINLGSRNTTDSEATVADKNFMGSNVSEPNSIQSLIIVGLMNLDQMGGIEMFFGRPIWPGNVLLDQLGQLEGGEAETFDFRDFSGCMIRNLSYRGCS